MHVAYRDQFCAVPAKGAAAAAAGGGKAALQRLKNAPKTEPGPGPSSSRPGLESGRWITEHCGVCSTKVYVCPSGDRLTGSKAYRQSEKDKAALEGPQDSAEDSW